MNNSICVITGAGTGLGRALSELLSKNNYTVYGLGRSLNTLQETQTRATSDQFNCVQVDISDYSQLKSALDEILSKEGKIDLLINNAAIYPRQSIIAQSAEDWDQCVATNTNAVAYSCMISLPPMIEKGYGRIINVGSWADIDPIADSAAYSCTKGAIHSLTKAVSKDLAAHNTDVQIFEWIPGHINTQMSDFTGYAPEEIAEKLLSVLSSEEFKSGHETAIFEGDQLFNPYGNSIKSKLKSAIKRAIGKK